jgi:hypothetical protein
MQGDLQPQQKLSPHWQPILQLAASSELEAALQDEHAANGSSLLGPAGVAVDTICTKRGCRLHISVHFPLVRNATAARVLGSGAVAGHHPAHAAITDWQEHLEGLYGHDISLRADGSDVLAISVAPSILQVCCPVLYFGRLLNSVHVSKNMCHTAWPVTEQ